MQQPGGARTKRKHPRFKVADLKELKATIDVNRPDEKILDLSYGGCSFYGSDQKWPTSANKRVIMTFEFAEFAEPLKIQGTILHIRIMPLADKKVVFYGIRFVDSENAKIAPLLKAIEIMHGRGLVKTS